MRFLFGCAGVPLDFYDLVLAQSDFISGADGGLFGFPLTSQPYQYTERDGRRVLATFAERLAKDHHNELAQTAFAVICVDHGMSTRHLSRLLFPSVLLSPVTWSPEWGSNAVKKRSANDLARRLRDAATQAKIALRALRHELQDRMNQTPLLLPTKNFRSDVLNPTLAYLQENLVSSNDHEAEIRRQIEEIERVHPRRKDRPDAQKFFVDARDIRFRSPGRDRHAFARPKDGHQDMCLVSGRRRLGSPYDHAFHYDCTKEYESKLRALVFGCHEDEEIRAGDPHLNIAPNDFVRP